MSLPDLLDYKSYDESNSAYLDGRYFNLVFNDYPGLIRNPVVITLYENYHKLKLKYSLFDTNHLNILRVIVQTKDMRHSMVILIDHQNKDIIIFDPSAQNNYHDIVVVLLKEELRKVFHEYMIRERKYEFKGMCVAYSIKFVYDTLLGKSFDSSYIKKFAARIEASYKQYLKAEEEDIEFGFLDDPQKKGIILGGLAGATLGGLSRGPMGALVGGGIGALFGNLLSKPNK